MNNEEGEKEGPKKMKKKISKSCNTNGISDHWASGLMGFRTNGFFYD